jgi:predicted small integral membrane protein
MKRNAFRPVAFFGTVAAMLAVMMLLTYSHATFSMSGIGSLKCYTTDGVQKAC